jgi:hypothetical protein
MRNLRLLSTTAALLLLSAGAVSAQGTKTDETPGTPAAHQNAPVRKTAPTLKTDQSKVPEKTGQVTPPAPTSDRKEMKTETMDKGAPAAATAKDSSSTGGSADVKSKGTNSAAESSAGAASVSGKSAEEGKGSATSQGAATPSAKLSTEQRTKISAIFTKNKVAPEHLNVVANVGTRIPDSVHFYPLPQEVFVIYPEWRGYEYIVVGDEVLVIDPRSHEIVAILEA